MVTNLRRAWSRLLPWLIGLFIVSAAVTAVLSSRSGQLVLTWVAAGIGAVSLLTVVVVRYGDDMLNYFADVGRIARRTADASEHLNAPGQTVPLVFRFGALVAAGATAYYVPPWFAELTSVRSPGFALLVAGQFLAQTFALWLTRPAPGNLRVLRSLAVEAGVHGTPDHPLTPGDVIEYYTSRYPDGIRPRGGRPRTSKLGEEWHLPFVAGWAEIDGHVPWRTPAKMLEWLGEMYRGGLDPVTAERMKSDVWEIVREARRPVRRVSGQHVGGGLLATASAFRVNRDLAVRAGFVVDDAWPLLKLVLPGDVRRRHLLADQAVMWSRLVFAVAVGWVVFCLDVSPVLAIVPTVLAVAALQSGRTRLVQAYEMRAATADVYRFELAKRLRIALPESQADFARLGAVLTGKSTDWRLAVTADGSIGAIHGDVVHNYGAHDGKTDDKFAEKQEQLLAAQNELAREVRQVSRQLEKGQAGQSQREWQTMTDERLSVLPSLLKATVAEVLAGPTMMTFAGYLAVEHLDDDAFVNGSTILAEPASQVGVVVSVLADPRARDTAPERGTDTDQFMVLQPIHIEGGRTAAEAEFELVVDSATLRPTPRRHTMRVAPSGQDQVDVHLLVPDQTGRHEAWLQLFQSGQLVQAIAVVVEAGHA
ncbi:hypothetical protein [Lentzea sp. CA-135723]|uniref:hypothetical protein n=1 Tax=Lentzea sp. CA-135723 TaxID=3239950 RepID=UPI003D8BE275